jgi:subtilase family serine protease
LRYNAVRARNTDQRHTKTRVFLARAGITVLTSGALALSFAGAAAARTATTASPVAKTAKVGSVAVSTANDYKRACVKITKAGQMACMVLMRTNVSHHAQAALGPDAAPSGDGYGPSSLQSAYDLPSATAGSGETVAVVDAYDDPDAASDLATYRSDWSLPACGTGCFEKVNENGATSPLPSAAGSTGWDVEESLDIDMVSAICPLCHIILVEANSADTADLGAGVNAAVSLGAKYVSNSYGGSESSSDPTYDTDYYNHPGVAVTASAGDDGYGVSYPAASQFVTSVGGTSLSTSSNSRGWTESVWGSSSGGEGTGSGCSADDAKPSWQTDTGCSKRTDNDVAADADPNTGLAVYDTYSEGGWLEVGGTSASSPMIASVFALAGTPASGSYPSSYIYQHTSSLFDVTSGSDGSCSPSYLCTAGTGYDGPTGWGTPDGTAAFTSGSTANTVTVTSPGNQSTAVGTAVSLQVKASDSASGQTLTYTANGLPAGLSINASSGLITGTPTTAGTSSVTVTATDTTGASGSATFSWTVNSAGTGCTAQQLIGNPGFETGSISPWSSSADVLTNVDEGVPAHSGSWLAWLDGYASSHTDTLSQTVTIPATCNNAQLSFWLYIQTNDPTNKAYDTFTVQVLNSSGTVLSTLATLSNLNTTGGYSQYSYSLAPYIGQKITLKFTGKETLNNGDNTSFFEDDNALNVS